MITILIVQSNPQLMNAGDTAMLQVALARFSELWANSTLLVLASCPEQLARHCPQATYVSSVGHAQWAGALLGRFGHHPPRFLADPSNTFERIVRYRIPALGDHLLNWKVNRTKAGDASLRSFRCAMEQADMIVATGGGYVNDEFPRYAVSVLRCFEWGIHQGKPTVMLGQGIGRLTSRRLRSVAKTILPSVDLIALREKRTSMPLLRSLGVRDDRILVTGDDAIELAYAARRQELGDAIGVNLRKAFYSGVTWAQSASVGAGVRAAADQLNAPLLPVPISEQADDNSVIAQMLQDSIPPTERLTLDTPFAVIEQIGRCRVVLTGSYHAGVFALAQGIPVVSVAGSQYYFDKFHGLADQFGGGCTVLDLNDDQLQRKIVDALINSWHSAGEVRSQLLAAAQQQIEAAHQAYQRIYSLVGIDNERKRHDQAT
jgi:polysaccharide pyruvyl transferase WcaK-like protein